LNKNSIIKHVDKFGLSDLVFEYFKEVVGKLSINHLSILEEHDIYATPYNAMIIDWCKGEDIFSLEITNKYIGYFIEISGVDIKQVTMGKIDNELLQDLDRFLNFDRVKKIKNLLS